MGKRLSSRHQPGHRSADRRVLAGLRRPRVLLVLSSVLVGLWAITGFASAHPPPWSHGRAHGHAHGHAAGHGYGHAAGHGYGHAAGHARSRVLIASGHVARSHGVGNGGRPPGQAKRYAAATARAASTHRRHRRRHHAGRRAHHRHRAAVAPARTPTATSTAPLPTAQLPLLASTGTGAGAAAGSTGKHVGGGTARHGRSGKRRVGRLRTASPTPVLLRFVHSIPWWVWLIVALALLLAAIAAAGALRARMLARRQELALAAVTAEALVDPLTGVLNRRGFIDAAERELARAQRYGRPFALAYADVKGLKVVNDTQGHLAGDQLIRQATALLEDSARADDVVGRLGGDEFGVLLVEQTQEGAAAVTSRIRERLPARRARLGLEVPWDLTIGTAAFPEDGGDVEELLRAADRRLYEQRGITLS